MSEAHDRAEPSWSPLRDVAALLDSQFPDHDSDSVLGDILARGTVDVLAKRNDIPSLIPHHVKDLLARAIPRVFAYDNEIVASFQFDTEQEADQAFGPRSDWREIDPDESIRAALKELNLPRGVADFRFLNLRLTEVKVDRPGLIRELRRLGMKPPEPSSFAPDESAIGQTKAPARPEPEPLRPAIECQIHNAIQQAYDEAKAAGERPPNLKEIAKPVRKILNANGFDKSARKIEELAGDDRYKGLRRQPGKTVASEKRAG